MKDKIIILALIILSFTLAGCKFSGKILDSDGKPVEGVAVELSGEGLKKETTTNGKGEYKFEIEPEDFEGAPYTNKTEWNYTITPVSVLYTFNKKQIPIKVNRGTPGEGISNIDFICDTSILEDLPLPEGTTYTHYFEGDWTEDAENDLIVRNNEGELLLFTLVDGKFLNDSGTKVGHGFNFTHYKVIDYDSDGISDLVVRKDDGKFLLFPFKNDTFYNNNGGHEVGEDFEAPDDWKPLVLTISVNDNIVNNASRTSIVINNPLDNAIKMQFSNEDNNWSGWEDYQPQKEWELLPGEGEKIIHAKYMEQDGGVRSATHRTQWTPDYVISQEWLTEIGNNEWDFPDRYNMKELEILLMRVTIIGGGGGGGRGANGYDRATGGGGGGGGSGQVIVEEYCSNFCDPDKDLFDKYSYKYYIGPGSQPYDGSWTTFDGHRANGGDRGRDGGEGGNLKTRGGGGKKFKPGEDGGQGEVGKLEGYWGTNQWGWSVWKFKWVNDTPGKGGEGGKTGYDYGNGGIGGRGGDGFPYNDGSINGHQGKRGEGGAILIEIIRRGYYR